MNNNKFYPSIIEERIYNLMENYIVGIEIYESSLTDVIFKMLENEFPNIEWQSLIITDSDELKGTVILSWIENKHLHMIEWKFIYV